jgi:hypothetical protein
MHSHRTDNFKRGNCAFKNQSKEFFHSFFDNVKVTRENKVAVNEELERSCKESVVVYYKIMSCVFLKGMVKIIKNSSQDLLSGPRSEPRTSGSQNMHFNHYSAMLNNLALTNTEIDL